MEGHLFLNWLLIVAVGIAFSYCFIVQYSGLTKVGHGTVITVLFKRAYRRAAMWSFLLGLASVSAITMTFNSPSIRLVYAPLGGAGMCLMMIYAFWGPFLFKTPPSEDTGRLVGLAAYGVSFGLPVVLQFWDKHVF